MALAGTHSSCKAGAAHSRNAGDGTLPQQKASFSRGLDFQWQFQMVTKHGERPDSSEGGSAASCFRPPRSLIYTAHPMQPSSDLHLRQEMASFCPKRHMLETLINQGIPGRGNCVHLKSAHKCTRLHTGPMFLVPPLLKLNICYHLAKEDVFLIALAFLMLTYGVGRYSG